VEQVWAVASDLERELPRCISTVREVRITHAEGDRLELMAFGTLGQRARFDVVLRPGWCLMRSRFVLGAMAAVPEAGGTRFASLGGFRLPGARLASPLLNVMGNRAMRTFTSHITHPVNRNCPRPVACSGPQLPGWPSPRTRGEVSKASARELMQ
jgi:hypothetical protein